MGFPGSSKHVGPKPKGVAAATGKMRLAKIKASTEMQLRGVPVDIVASSMGVNPKTIAMWNKDAEKLGILEEVRTGMMSKLLPKVAETYDRLLSTPAEVLETSPKGHEIHRKAASDLASGLGVFKKESESKQVKATMDLEAYLKYREMRRSAQLQDIKLAEEVIEAATKAEEEPK